MTDLPTWRIWLLLCVLLVLQTTVFARISPFGVHLDLALMAVVSVALLFGVETGAVFGLIAGAFTGYASGVGMGAFVLSRLLIGIGFGNFNRHFSRDNPLALPLCAALATVGAHMTFGIFSPGEFSFEWWMQQTLTAAAVHMFLIWPVHWLFVWFVFVPKGASRSTLSDRYG